ncbi:MAG: hypothetical protein JOZ23_10355 [Mycobacterium sp.]|nr:hypothetical protein [Mycobacterium sp.]
MADDELDELYRVKPDGFIALRTKLANAAKRRGDNATAKQISASNKPTTAAWIVNRLALTHTEVKQRLADLGDRLRAAHAEMDGDRIRELSAEQRKLVDELARTGFEAAELSNPSAAIRDAVTATLQAAIADPDVRAALGRLSRPERWSGFGAFGEAAEVFAGDRGDKEKAAPKQTRPKPAKRTPRANELEAARQQNEKLKAALSGAERVQAEADDALSERQADLAAARLRLDKARESLRSAEHALSISEDSYDRAKQASREAAELVKEARVRLRRKARSRR